MAARNLSNFPPNGAWIASTETQSGRSEVYVLSANATLAQRLRISVDGGEEPRWSPDGRTIVFRSGMRWYASTLPGGDRPVASAPRLLFTGPYENVAGYPHDLFPDSRHLVLRQPGERTARQLVVVTDSAAAARRTTDRP